MLPNISGTFRCIKDPDLRYSAGGMAICSFTAVADKKKKNEATGEWEDDKVIFVRVTTFKGLAEHVAESVQKGVTVLVQGQASVSEWETKEGEKRSTVEITANEVGVSLFWDTATVNKAERGQGGAAGANRAAPADDPWSTPPAPGTDPWNTSTTTGSDEPPF